LISSVCVSLVCYLVFFCIRRNLSFFAMATLGLVFFHIIMLFFFTRELTLKNIVYFGGIWIMPFIIAGMIIFTIRGMRYPFKTYSGLASGLLVFAILISKFQLNITEELMVICLFIVF